MNCGMCNSLIKNITMYTEFFFATLSVLHSFFGPNQMFLLQVNSANWYVKLYLFSNVFITLFMLSALIIIYLYLPALIDLFIRVKIELCRCVYFP